MFRIVRNLKSTSGKGLFFVKHGHTELETDVDWVGSVKDIRSTRGYCSFVVGNLVTR